MRSPCHLAMLSGLLLATAGCMPYQVGVDTLYPQDIRTVHVRMFESNSYRRYLSERLTEAVVKEIESRTPYKVVDLLRADSVLSGTIIQEDRDVLVEGPFDDTREAQVNFSVRVNWTGRQMVQPVQAEIRLPEEVVRVDANAALVPEVGQSLATAQQLAIQRLAARIVDLMEADPLAGVDAPPGFVP